MSDYRQVFLRLLSVCWGIVIVVWNANGQGLDDPLLMQGVDHLSEQSAASRSAGGISLGVQKDAGMMFAMPASLQSLESMQLLCGGSDDYVWSGQTQQYAPLKYYSNFSLLMEGLTGYIRNPDTSHHGSNAGDTVQRPYDNIGPNWSKRWHNSSPVQALVGIPVMIGDRRYTIGGGMIEYANLNHYFQNNNVLSPAIGSERPVPTPLPTTDSLPVQWSQYIRSRDGALRGYGVAFSGSPIERLSLGVSFLYLKGSTDDFEQHTGRGTLIFFASYFRLDSVYHRVTRTGTSDFTGQEYTISGIYHGRNITVGCSIKPPLTITRKYTGAIRTIATGLDTTVAVSGEDNIRLPWRGMIGLAITLREGLTLGLEYEMLSSASAVYTDTSGNSSNPWSSTSVIHVGTEYVVNDWLSLRAGMRKQAEVFEPAGNPIVGDPVSYTVYSVGCGLLFARLHLNVSYEYGHMKYDDTWQASVNLNDERHHRISADLVYDIPWTWH